MSDLAQLRMETAKACLFELISSELREFFFARTHYTTDPLIIIEEE